MKVSRRFVVSVVVWAGVLANCAWSAEERANTVDLAGTWSVRQADGDKPAIPMQIPGDVHSALLAAKLIPDPYFGRNENEVQWVGEKEWIICNGR